MSIQMNSASFLRTMVTSTSRNVATTGTQTITGVGFKPKNCICFYAISAATLLFGNGISDGTNHKTTSSNYLGTAMNIDGGDLISVNPSAGNTASAVVTSFDNDGVTLTWSKVGTPAGTVWIYFVFFG